MKLKFKEEELKMKRGVNNIGTHLTRDEKVKNWRNFC